MNKISLFLIVLLAANAVAKTSNQLEISVYTLSYDTINFVGAELLGRPTDRSVTINVIPRTELEVRFEYGTDTFFGSSTPAETTVANEPHEVIFDGLMPDTRYYYRMCYRVLASGDSLIGPNRMFHTQRASGETFTFAVEADPHMVPGEGDSVEVFELTLQNIAASNPDFLIDLGDNFMLDKWNVVNADTIRERMHQYRRWWDEVCHSIPLFIVLGNHEGEQGWDYDTTPTCLPVLFTNARKLYYPNPFPDGFYTGDSIPEQFVGLREDYYAWEWGNCLFVALDPFWHTMIKPNQSGNNWDWTLGREQFDWFKNTLETSRAKFKFVFIHHLVGGKIDATARGGSEYAHFYEWGGLNSDSTWGFDTLRPGWGVPIHQLMIDNGVDIMFHGHDHFYAKQDTDGIVYQMVPQPGRKRWDSIPQQAAEYGYLSGTLIGPRGYVRVTVNDTSATVDYIRTFLPGETTATRHNGEVSYSYTIIKPGTAISHLSPVSCIKQFNVTPSLFRQKTVISFSLAIPVQIQLKIYSVTGAVVKTFITDFQLQGQNKVIWDGTDNSGRKLSAGVYICRLNAGGFIRSACVVLLRL